MCKGPEAGEQTETEEAPCEASKQRNQGRFPGKQVAPWEAGGAVPPAACKPPWSQCKHTYLLGRYIVASEARGGAQVLAQRVQRLGLLVEEPHLERKRVSVCDSFRRATHSTSSKWPHRPPEPATYQRFGPIVRRQSEGVREKAELRERKQRSLGVPGMQPHKPRSFTNLKR